MGKLDEGVADGLDNGDEQGLIDCLSFCGIVRLGSAWWRGWLTMRQKREGVRIV